MFNLIIYIIAAISTLSQILGLLVKNLYQKKIYLILQSFVVIMLLAVLIFRSISINFIALTGTFESLLFYSLVIYTISSFYLLQNRFRYYPIVHFFVSFIGLLFLLIASSPLVDSSIVPPIPALRSAWLLLHVSFSFIGEGFFVFSFVLSLFIVASKDLDKIRIYDQLSYTVTLIGYAFFTSGALIFGAIWAEAAWGAFWSWDPKETWALITWIIYSLYLHLRVSKKSRYKLNAWLLIVGFLSTMFTFFGVNYLLAGLHSYV